METEPSDFDRGKREGRIDALLESHTKSIARLDIHIERQSESIEHLTKAVNKGMAALSDGLRTMQEEGRARDLAVKVAAETLAAETERRREELASAGAAVAWQFTKRQGLAVILIAAAAVVVSILIATKRI